LLIWSVLGYGVPWGMEKMRKIKVLLMSSLFLAGMLTLALNVQPVKASGTVYIRADGSVDPPGVPISTVDNVTYTLTNNISDSIVVERDNIVLDGAGYTVQGTGVFGSKGIDLSYRSNVTVKNTTVTRFHDGIYLNYSSNNRVSCNKATNNTGYGIYLYRSGGNTLSTNIMSGNRYNFGVEGETGSDFDNVVDLSNLADGRPIYYVRGTSDAVYDSSTNAATIYLIDSNNVTVRDLTLAKNHYGALLWNTNNSRIENLTATSNRYGIRLKHTVGNAVSSNTVTNNDDYGIHLVYSGNNAVSDNTVTNNRYGIWLAGSNNSMVSGNNAKNNFKCGIHLSLYSNNNTVSGNNATNNSFGIYLSSASNNTVSENNADNNGYGIFIGFSSNNTVSGNNATNNNCGIHLWESVGNAVSGNNATDNYYGIYLYNSSSNTFYHNNFIDNINNVYNYQSNNTWDDGYPSGGNYWSDYTGVDVKSGPDQDEPGSDGIGDTPYTIDANNKDRYPLMNPWPFPDLWPPRIDVLSPQNITYTKTSVPLTFTVNEPASWMGYSLDGQPNATITGNTTLTGLSEGAHSVTVYANDTSGNMGFSDTVYFTIFTAPTVDIDPDTLNLKSKGKWITAYIELPGDCNVSEIDASTILLNGTLGIDPGAPTAIEDYDDDGVPDLMVKFDRPDVTDLIIDGLQDMYGKVTLTLTGNLTDGTSFEGSDTIRVISPVRRRGDADGDGHCKGADLLILCKSWWSCHGDPNYDPRADFNDDGCVKTVDFTILCKNWFTY